MPDSKSRLRVYEDPRLRRALMQTNSKNGACTGNKHRPTPLFRGEYKTNYKDPHSPPYIPAHSVDRHQWIVQTVRPYLE